MKKKIIIICVAIIAVAGGTAGITVAVTNSQNSDETESLVNEAVSSALEEAASETEDEEFSEQNTDEESTKETAAKQKKPASNSETTTSQTTYPQVVYDTDENVMQRSDNGNSNRVDPERGEKSDLDKQDTIETPLGIYHKSDNNRKQDEIGYYWPTSWTCVPDPNSAAFYVYNIDENNELFYFDKNDNRVYPEF